MDQRHKNALGAHRAVGTGVCTAPRRGRPPGPRPWLPLPHTSVPVDMQWCQGDCSEMRYGVKLIFHSSCNMHSSGAETVRCKIKRIPWNFCARLVGLAGPPALGCLWDLWCVGLGWPTEPGAGAWWGPWCKWWSRPTPAVQPVRASRLAVHTLGHDRPGLQHSGVAPQATHHWHIDSRPAALPGGSNCILPSCSWGAPDPPLVRFARRFLQPLEPKELPTLSQVPMT